MIRLLLGLALVSLAVSQRPGRTRTVKGPPPPSYRSKDIPDNYKPPPLAAPALPPVPGAPMVPPAAPPAPMVPAPAFRPLRLPRPFAVPPSFTPLGQPGVPPPAFIRPGPPPRRSKDVPDNSRFRTALRSGPPPRRYYAQAPPAPVFFPTRPVAALPPPVFPMYPDPFFPAQNYPTEPPRFYDVPEVKKEEEEENKS